MPSRGSVAIRVPSPTRISAEQPTSNVAVSVAASTGGNTGTRYSSRKSAPVGSQLAIFVSPACRKRSEEHTSELQSQSNLVCRLLLEKKKKNTSNGLRRGMDD